MTHRGPFQPLLFCDSVMREPVLSETPGALNPAGDLGSCLLPFISRCLGFLYTLERLMKTLAASFTAEIFF